ncbi:hypothetical protein N7462_003690 [Penicillium macrosclerotiorum]|uniref:uncharacterized protein n=1 Tax=Penicillium macrosclerotiorum TaxID=303699 RepID=UPI0025465844|nr:uncharacterized protein N7462_003690 [Penicillium macrosclerotiorum]KAJ5689298.1 hypothetical protein N7462_003690 [Penicillium macrosclerotiorum]
MHKHPTSIWPGRAYSHLSNSHQPPTTFTLPAPFAQIPRHPILYPHPSPIHPLPNFLPNPPSHHPDHPRINLYAKREDQSAPLACAGNKYRKLEYIVPDILSPAPVHHYHEALDSTPPPPLRGPATTLVTEGALQSNHTVQVAALAAHLRLKALVLLNKDTGGGYRASREPALFAHAGNAQILRLLGAEVDVLESEDGDAGRVLDELAGRGERPYWIPGGASRHVRGGLGYARGAIEIAAQEAEMQLGGSGRFDVVFVACGSGSTVGGLVAGFKLLEKTRREIGRKVVGVINSPTQRREWHEARVLAFARQAGTMIGLAEGDVTTADVCLEDRFVGEAYGIVEGGSEDALRAMAQRDGVVLDPVYTAKVVQGLRTWMAEDKIRQYAQQLGLNQVNVLFIHTGGQAAMAAYVDRI